MITRWSLLLLILLAIPGPLAVPPAAGQAPSTTVNDPEGLRLLYRWVFAPEDRREEWPLQDTRYWPMDAEEFRRMVDKVNAAREPAGLSMGASIASARYEAKLAGDALVDGTALLDVAYAGSEPVSLPLAPCGVAIDEANWADKDGQAAQLGLSDDQELEVRLNQPGKLQFGWSLRGQSDARGTIVFFFDLPPSPAIRLFLDLPEAMTPVPDKGIVTQEPQSDGEMRRWRIELGGHHRFVLRVVREEDSPRGTSPSSVRQVLTYDFSLHEMNLSAKLQFIPLKAPLQQITLLLDPGLRLVTAGLEAAGNDGSGLVWTELAAADEEATRIVLELPDHVRGARREILLGIGAVAPLKLDEPWRLPQIRPEGMRSQRTEAVLRAADPLRIDRIVPIGGRQSKPLRKEQFIPISLRPGSREEIPQPKHGEIFEVEYGGNKGGVEIVLTRPEAPIELDFGCAVKLGNNEMTARMVARFHVAEGERFVLEADLRRQWIFDPVESIPPGIVADWRIQSSPQAARRLVVRLTKPLVPGRPIQLLITARRLRTRTGRRHGIDDLVPLQFRASGGARQLIWLHTTEPYQLTLDGDQQLGRLAPQSLDAGLRELFAEPPGDVLFENDARAAELRVSLETRKPDYTASIRVEATVRETSLVERYVLRCDPEAGRVDRVLVRFSGPEEGEVHWDLGTEDKVHAVQEFSPTEGLPPALENALGPSESEARLPEDPAERPLEGRQTWEIELNPPRSAPFEILATRTRKRSETQTVNLVSLPEATHQQATAVVSFAWPTVARIENKGLTPISTEPAPAAEYPTAKATFRYDPFGDTAGEPASLTIVPHDLKTRLPAAWVWSCRLQSRYQPDGMGHHRATYRVQASGQRRLVLTLPPTITRESVHEVWVDNARTTGCVMETAPGGSLTVELPPKRKFPIVTICFATRGPALSRIDTLTAPVPVPDVAVLSRHWTVWLPPGYEALAGAGGTDFRPATGSSLPQRLFGPLGRAASETPIDPFAPKEWSRILGAPPGRRSAVAKAAGILQQIAEKSSAAEDVRSQSQWNWGTLLADEAIIGLLGDGSRDRPKLLFLVDSRAVAEAGLSPRTTVRAASGGVPAARGAAMLRQAGLALLVHSQAILLSSAIHAGVYRSQLTPLDGETLWWVRPGPLAEQIEEAVAGRPGGTLLPVAQWRRRPPAPQAPWRNLARSGYRPNDTLGWTAYRMEIPAGGPAELPIIHRETFQSVRWITFLAIVAVAWWKLLRRPAVLTVLAGTSAVATLLLPELFVQMASGGLLAALCALGFGLMCTEPTGTESSAKAGNDSSGSHRRRTVIRGGLLLAAIAAISAGSSRAGPEESDQELPRAYWIFVPVDENQEPTGGNYKVPEGFYQELNRRAANLSGQSESWLLSAATYRGKLSRRFRNNRLMLSEFGATFALEIFAPEARVRIPLIGEGTDLLLKSAKLDGRSIQPQWQEKGGGWVFDVFASSGCSARRPERYLLELTLQPPPIQTEGSTAGFDLRIPRLATSRLQLAIPRDAPKVEVPFAVGSVTRVADPAGLIAELGPNDRLRVRWEDGTALSVEELLWLSVRPSSVVLDARFTFQLGEGLERDLFLLIDPQWRRQGPYRCNGEQIEVDDDIPGRTPDQPRTARLELDQFNSNEVTIAASFKLKQTAGVGNIQLPLLSTRGTRITRRWMAVSVDPLLDHRQQESRPPRAVAVNEFADAWGDTELEPSMAFDLGSSEPPWQMTTTRREPKTTVQQTTTVDYGPLEVALSFEAKLLVTDGDRVQYRLDVPRELAVLEVSVREDTLLETDDGPERVARWASTSEGEMAVFLNAPVTDQHTLWIRGHLTPAGEDELPLPVIRIEQADLVSSRIELFRQPRVRVEVVDARGLIELEFVAPDQDSHGASRCVKRFEADGSEPVAGRVKISPNRPVIYAGQVTFLEHDGSSWNAKVDFSLDVRRGLVDELHLTVPPSWSGPYEVDPPMAVEPGGENGRHLVLRPRTAIEGKHHFTISGPLSFTPTDRVSVPEIVLEDAELRNRRLILPTQSQLQPVDWEVEGLRQIDLPEDLLPRLVAPESFVAYRVKGRSFRAAIRPLGAAEAQVDLADVCLAWRPDGSCHGVVAFDLQSADLSECTVRVPVGYDLIQVTVSGISVTPIPDKPDRWRVPLGTSKLPQRIEVVFAGTLSEPEADGRRRFAAPMLDGLKVHQTLWTVSGPASFALAGATDLPLVSPVKHASIRLRNLTRLIDLSRDADTEGPDGWYSIWIRRWAAAAHEVGHYLGASDGDGNRRAISAELESLIRGQEEIAQRLAVTDVLQSALDEAAVARGAIGLWHLTRPGEQSSVRLDMSGAAGAIALTYHRTDPDGLADRLVASAELIGLTLFVLLGIRVGAWAAVLRRWPHLVSVIAGLAWWLWLRPDYLGLLVIVFSLAASCRRGWKSSGQSSSAIIPLSVNRG